MEEGNVLFNNAFNSFYLRLCDISEGPFDYEGAKCISMAAAGFLSLSGPFSYIQSYITITKSVECFVK